jgi:hypothetical protein
LSPSEPGEQASDAAELRGYLLWHLGIADAGCILTARGIRTAPDRSERRFLATQMRVEHSHALRVKDQLTKFGGSVDEISVETIDSLGALIDLCDRDWSSFLIASQFCFPSLTDVIGQELHSRIEPDVASVQKGTTAESSGSASYARDQLCLLASTGGELGWRALQNDCERSSADALRYGRSVVEELLDIVASEWPTREVPWQSLVERAVTECEANLSDLLGELETVDASDAAGAKADLL